MYSHLQLMVGPTTCTCSSTHLMSRIVTPFFTLHCITHYDDDDNNSGFYSTPHKYPISMSTRTPV